MTCREEYSILVDIQDVAQSVGGLELLELLHFHYARCLTVLVVTMPVLGKQAAWLDQNHDPGVLAE